MRYLIRVLVRLLLVFSLAVAVPRPAAADTLGANCPGGALFSSIECRLGSLLAWAKGSGPPASIATKLQRLLQKANAKMTSAEKLVGKHHVKAAHARVGQADKSLSKADALLSSVVVTPMVEPRGTPPTATPAEALAFCEGIQTDVTTVKSTLVTKGPILFAEICCVRLCIPTLAVPDVCAIVQTIPCTSPACAAIASCVAEGCEPLPAPIGTTCAQLYANECTASPSCDAYNPSCAAPPS